MAYPLPPWLHPVDPVAPFMQGVNQGADIVGQQNRMELAIQELTLRREAEQRAREAQNISNTRAANDFALRQQAQALKAQQAARQWQGEQRYQELIAGGKSPQEAWMEVAPVIAPGTVGTSLYHQQNLAESSRRNAETERHNREMEAAALKRAEQQAAITPEIVTLNDPLTGKAVPIIKGGNRWQKLNESSDAGSKSAALALRSISDEGLKARQKGLEGQLPTAVGKYRDTIQDELTKVRTERTNLVMNALTPPTATSSKDAKFKSDDEEESWYNAKRALAKGANREAVIKRMRDMGFTTEGL